MLTNFYKLVNGAHTTDNSPVANRYMPCHLRIITGNTIITHQTIMRKMAIRHDQAVFANHRFITILRTTVYCNKFTDGCTITYIYIGILALEL